MMSLLRYLFNAWSLIGLVLLSEVLTPADAHATSNSVYIGQTGVTNTIDITQAGVSNQVGGEGGGLLLNQQGRDNSVSISQTGFANAVATVAHVLPVGAIYPVAAIGIDQIGSRNLMAIVERNLAPYGSNAIEAIRQYAADGFASVSNRLSVTQTPDGGADAAAEHYVGEIVQINPDAGAAENDITIVQTGGGAGLGNFVESVRHEGHGNAISISQSATSNAISFVRQIGDGNEQTLSQRDGGGNILWASLQYGDRNRLSVTESGNRNHVWSVLQNDAVAPGAGNVATISLSGDDNGGDGRGGLGRFATVAGEIGAVQARVAQLGDGNSLSYTVGGADGAPASARNLFGFVEDGMQNAIAGTVTGIGNEAAVAETGDGNDVAFAQSGEGNALAVRIYGARNHADFEQSGSGNVAHVTFGGPLGTDGTNRPGLSFSAALSAPGLSPGTYRQQGTGNELVLAILSGSSNASATFQAGTGNTIVASVSGAFNQAVVVQRGSGNHAAFSQNGSNNRLIMMQ